MYIGLQIRFRTFDTGFICASAIGYDISSPILKVDKQQRFIFRQNGIGFVIPLLSFIHPFMRND
jgi:hypothetical protein